MITASLRFGVAGCAVFLVLAAACARGGADTRNDQPAAGDTLSVSGTLVDTRCLVLDPANAGVDHIRPEGRVPDCARACANAGFPVAVLVGGVRDGDVWVLVTAPAIFADYMAAAVRVRGTVRSAGVLVPHRVEHRDGDQWLTIL